MAAVTAPPPIRVVIDRLVLHGVDRADAAAVQRALAAEVRSALARAGGSAFAASRDLPNLQLTVGPGGDPAQLGRSAGAGLGAALVRGRGEGG